MGGLNLYGFVGNDSVNNNDYLGHHPTIIDCEGTCGADIGDWVIDEINAQIAGWKGGNTSIEDYLKWANGNQRYKDPRFFEFSKGTSCGTKSAGSTVGCGSSVTLCGRCIRSAILGNIMYGLVAKKAGFGEVETIEAPTDVKKRWRMTVSPNDRSSYTAGLWMGSKLDSKVTIDDVCLLINSIALGTPKALREDNESGGMNNLTTCKPCSEKTKETRHGGSENPRRMP